MQGLFSVVFLRCFFAPWDFLVTVENYEANGLSLAHNAHKEKCIHAIGRLLEDVSIVPLTKLI